MLRMEFCIEPLFCAADLALMEAFMHFDSTEGVFEYFNDNLHSANTVQGRSKCLCYGFITKIKENVFIGVQTHR